MTRKLVSKKELKTVYGIPYCFAHIARLEAAGQFSESCIELHLMPSVKSVQQ
jgi:hypothetical protein